VKNWWPSVNLVNGHAKECPKCQQATSKDRMSVGCCALRALLVWAWGKTLTAICGPADLRMDKVRIKLWINVRNLPIESDIQ